MGRIENVTKPISLYSYKLQYITDVHIRLYYIILDVYDWYRLRFTHK